MSDTLSSLQARLEANLNVQDLDPLNTADVLFRCADVIDNVQIDNHQHSMDHPFFDVVQQFLVLLENSADRFDFPNDDNFLAAADAIKDSFREFCSWRQHIRDLPRQVQELNQDMTAFLQLEHPNVANITQLLERLEETTKNICNVTALDANHLRFAELAIECIQHVQSKSLFRPYNSYDRNKTDPLSDALLSLRLKFDSSDLAEDADDIFGLFFDQDEQYLNPSETRDAIYQAHDDAANRRRSHFQHGVLVDWLTSHGHGEVYNEFLAYVETLVEREQHPAGNVSFP